MSQDRENGVTSYPTFKPEASLSKFLAKPKHFKGDDDENPLRWLKRINRIRKGVPMGDQQCLTMAGSYLTGAAESWWEMVEDKVATWAQFEAMFRSRFAGKDKHHIWWNKVESRKQLTGETVDEVANDLKEYFELLDVSDDGIRIRHLLKALRENISYELEQRATLSSYEDVVQEARKLEVVQNKYGRVGANIAGSSSSTVVGAHSGSEITPSESASVNAVQGGNLSSQISALANEIQALKINMVDVRRAGKRQWVSLKEVNGAQEQANPPDNKAGVNLLHGVKVYAQKRGRQQLSENGSAVAAAAVQKKKGRVDGGENDNQGTGGASGAIGVSGGNHVQAAQAQAMDVDQKVPAEEKKPKKKRHVRKLAVVLPQKDVWERLKQVDAGLSVADWLSLSKHAAKDVQDGIRHWHGRKPRGVRVGDSIQRQPPSTSVPVNYVDLHEHDLTDSSDEWAYSDEDDGTFRSDSSDVGSDGFAMVDGDDVGYESDDTQYEYPYNLDKMRESAPLQAPITIHGHLVQAVFDSGAGVSVISKNLAEKVGLKTNGDKLVVEAFGDNALPAGGVSVAVPVRAAGKLRPEHMTIQDVKGDVCLLGTSWHRQYGVRVDHQTGTIHIPTGHGRGSVLLQGRYPRSENEHDNVVLAVSVSGSQSSSMLAMDGDHKGGTLDLRREEATKDTQLLNRYVDEVLKANGEEESEMPQVIKDVVDSYACCFVEVSGLGRVHGVEHTIPTTTEKPIRTAPYRLSWEEQDHLRDELNKLLELGLIKPSDGKWTSPILFVKKKDGTLRLCVDYRKLNEITVKDAFPLPNIDELLDSVGGARYFSTLDAASGYWQIPLAADSIAKSGFTTKWGTYTWQAMPFGLCSAPQTFQRAVTNILSPFIGDFVHVFIDDIIVCSKDLEEHAVHLTKVMEACQAANLRLKRSKCVFGHSQVEYLGHVITGDGLLRNARNTEKIMKMPTPRNAKEIKIWLGTTGYYRRHIKGYAQVARPLTRLLKQDVAFVWDKEEQLAFDTLKHALISPPVLAYPDRNQVQILTTDASTHGLGAVLSQSPTGDAKGERVIAYASRSLRGSEERYAATHLEALAVVWAVEYFRHYLSGRRFVLYTDHAALPFIFQQTRPSVKLTRWAASLMEYNFVARYRPGRANPADALSRLLPAVGVDDDEELEKEEGDELE